jgi:hypothetical protein
MRACLTSAVALAAVVLSFGSAWAGHGCNPCGAHGCRLHHHHQYIDGKDYGFNCGCNGSYNYPVPPLYTYHWPGMYKAERMTDYHSPWRFPPIRPFTDEAAAPAMISEEVVGELQTISAVMPISGKSTLGQPESLSIKLLRSIR